MYLGRNLDEKMKTIRQLNQSLKSNCIIAKSTRESTDNFTRVRHASIRD